MAFTASFTAKRGQVQLKDVAIGAGSAEVQSDTITLNVDITNMTKGDAIVLVEAILQKIHATAWPPA